MNPDVTTAIVTISSTWAAVAMAWVNLRGKLNGKGDIVPALNRLETNVSKIDKRLTTVEKTVRKAA